MTDTPKEPVVDKAAAAAGAITKDLDGATTKDGAPAPAPAPKNKAEADAAAKEEPKEEPTEEPTEEPVEDTSEEPKEEPKEDPAPLDVDVWGSTGDEVGDSVLELLQNSGMETDAAKAMMYDAVQGGDVTKIDVAALEQAVGKAQANLIMAGTRDFITRSKAKAEAIVTEVHTTVGGKENWDAVTTWAKTNVPAADLSDYASMIDAGGAKARFAASEMAALFNGDDANTTLDATKQEITPTAKAVVSSKATTRAEYFKAIEAAHASNASEADITKIKADRARGRAKGI